MAISPNLTGWPFALAHQPCVGLQKAVAPLLRGAGRFLPLLNQETRLYE